MKFLSVLGQVLLTGTKLITGFGSLFPQQATVIGKIEDIFTKVAGLVVQAEAFGQALGISGADKLKAVIPSVTQLFLQSDLLYKKKIKDAALFSAGISKVASGVADILNSLDSDIETENVVK